MNMPLREIENISPSDIKIMELHLQQKTLNGWLEGGKEPVRISRMSSLKRLNIISGGGEEIPFDFKILNPKRSQ